MLIITRRDFFKKTGATAVAFGILKEQMAGLKALAAPLGLPVGSQTYPHRQRVGTDFPGLLRDMKALGIEAIELCSPSYGENDFGKLADGKATRRILDDNGMKALSCHFGMNVLRDDLQKQVDWALDLGMIQMSTATLSGRTVNGVTTEDEVQRAAAEYNKIAESAKRNGMQQILHNEGFENSRLEDGRLTYPVLLQYLDPNLVKMQFQMSSMPTVGNPITYFQNHPGRFASAHLQGVNAAAGMREAQPGALPVKREGGAGRAGGRGGRGGRGGGGLALGEDSVDWPAVFEAAKVGGMQTFFVEQNWDLTVKSVAYLKTLS